MSRPSVRRLVMALAAFSCLPAIAADDPKEPQAPAGVPKKAGIAKKGRRPAEVAKKVESSLVFLTELNIVQLSIETDPLVRWVKPVFDAVESRFREESGAGRS